MKGAAFKAQTLGPRRLKGVGAFALSAWTYANWTTIAMMVGHSVPMVAITASVIYGITKFNYSPEITAVSFQEGGQHDGWLKVTVNETPFSGKTITVNPAHIMSIATYSADT